MINKNGIILCAAISLIVVLGIGCGVAYAYAVSNNVNVSGDYHYHEAEAVEDGEQPLGAFPGPDVYADVNIYGTLISDSGSYNNSTTTDADTYTFVAKDIQPYGYLEFDYTGAANISYTMPATSTMMSMLPLKGSNRTWTIHNASTTGVLTLVAGAGMNLLGVDTNVDTIAADGWAELKCMQINYVAANNENIACLMTEYLVAD